MILPLLPRVPPGGEEPKPAGPPVPEGPGAEGSKGGIMELGVMGGCDSSSA